MNQFSIKPKANPPSVCLVHDWLVAMRGGEKVLEALAELFPEAPIYTLFAKKDRLSPILQKRKIYTSFLQYVPGIEHFYRWLLPLFPIAIHSLSHKRYDLVISSSHCVAKAVPVKKDCVHICYCHTPMRYLWGFSDEYLGKFPKWFRRVIGFYFGFLRKWDVATSRKVSAFIANSKNTADKISRLYGKTAAVIHPPVEVSVPNSHGTEPNGKSYFLIVSALVPYKRTDIAIEAFNRLEKWPLKIVGDGPERKKLERRARFHKIEFEGWLEQAQLFDRYLNCRALIFPGEEDFGIVPLEAQAFGKPVIAFGKGGVIETVLPYGATRKIAESTGLFFPEQTSESLIQALDEFQNLKFNGSFIKSHAMKFGTDRFKTQFSRVLNELCK